KYSGLNIRNLSAAKALLKISRKGLNSPLIITPDSGASYLLKGEPSSHSMKKQRGAYAKGKTTYRKISSLEADFEPRARDLILIDDIVAGGSTMLKATHLCKRRGARKIVCACTHGQFLNGSDKKLKRAGATKLITTDSIKSKHSKLSVLGLTRSML
ncbi:hypothetical protein DRN67_03050, partial [Candidatus Micrarchaeota archaeon]